MAWMEPGPSRRGRISDGREINTHAPRSTPMLTTPFSFLIIAASCATQIQGEPAEPLVEKYLVEGKLAEGEKVLADAVQGNPNDARARFGLGTVQFLRAVERMVQSFHRYGLRAGVLGNGLPFVRLPIPPNDAP